MFKLLSQLAWRSLWSHRAKSLVVGTVIAIGVFLLVLADALLDSIHEGMESSITASITGHLQIYDNRAEDKLSLMGTMGNFLTKPHIGQIENFQQVRRLVEQHPNVTAVIPMGTDSAIIFSGNSMDQTTDALRDTMAQFSPNTGDDLKVIALQPSIDRVNSIVEHLRKEYELILQLSESSTETEQALQNLARVSDESFWRGFIENPTPQLQFLETRIAPLMDDSMPVFLEILGTDLDRFQNAFERFKIVKGEMVPEGKRGLLINDFQYEKIMKDRMARVFDSISELKKNEGMSISENPELKIYVDRRAKEYKKWILSFESTAANKIEQELQTFLNLPDEPLETLIPEFMNLSDENFDRRKEFFYNKIRPEIKLYPVAVGDMLTLNKFGNGESQRVRFYGTYEFDGVEKTGFSGLFHLVDMITFRELYGFLTEQQKQEIASLKEEFSTKEWQRSEVEDALFSDSSFSIERLEDQLDNQQATPDFQADDFEFQEDDSFDVIAAFQQQHEKSYRQQDIDRGATLSAAVVLKNVEQLQQTRTEIEQLLNQQQLPMQVIDWQTASGHVGQMITVMKIVLFIFIIFVFSVSMVVINNAMLMSTIHRYGEIGTLRAIGTGRGIIMGTFLIESFILTLLSSLIGALAGFLFVIYLSNVGIPAPRMEIQFLFGGQRLHPSMHLSNVYMGPLVILFVGIAATFYPALLATRVPPVVAMNARE